MDELQARIRTIRSLQTEMNLAKQPYPEFDYPDDDQRHGEANVVEMPTRQAQRQPPSEQSQTQKRKQRAAKPKPAESQKAFPFRQMRDGHQQPYIDELKRLQAQAERINQLLAERKRKKAQLEESGALAAGERSPDAETSPPKKKSVKGSRQASRSRQQDVQLASPQDDDTEALEAQSERIKHLLKELETALVQEDAMPKDEAIERKTAEAVAQAAQQSDTIAQASVAGIESFTSGTYRYGADAPPFTANQKPPLPETDQKAQQEATETAQALRYLAKREVIREQVQATIAPSTYPKFRRDNGPRLRSAPSPFSVRRCGLWLRQFLQVPQTTFDKVGDAVLWLVLAAAIRVGARFLLTLFPALTPVFVLLMFAPAAFAVYLAMFVPKAGFVSIYRLFLIMLGLLLGGRL